MHPNFHIFSYTLNSYDVIVAIGCLLAAIYLLVALSKIQYIRKIDLILFVLTLFVVQQIGGTAIPYVWKFIRKGAWPHLYDGSHAPGRYFHSVFLTSLIYVFFICRHLKWPTKKFLDKFFIAAIMASAIGRIGCFMQGCCRGKATTLPWCLHFPRFPLECLHPTQLYMLGAEIVLFIALFIIDKNKRADGFTFWTGVFLYSIYRFSIEFFRVNPTFILGLSHAQVFSIFTFCASLMVLLKKSSQKNITAA